MYNELHYSKQLDHMHCPIFSGPLNQPPTVVVSGKNISETLTFRAGREEVLVSPFTINNDRTALETLEMYPLMMTGSSITMRVELDRRSMIMIEDDDGKQRRLSFPSLMPFHCTEF